MQTIIGTHGSDSWTDKEKVENVDNEQVKRDTWREAPYTKYDGNRRWQQPPVLKGNVLRGVRSGGGRRLADSEERPLGHGKENPAIILMSFVWHAMGRVILDIETCLRCVCICPDIDTLLYQPF